LQWKTRCTEMEEPNLETRWIVLGTDGRHVTLGRHTDPTQEEVAAAEAALAAQGMAGWLTVVKGAYYARRTPSLMMVRPLADPACTFDEAAAEFEAKRKGKLATLAR